MKTLRVLANAVALSLVAITPAFAVDTAKVYNSGLMVLIFLGFFALVVIVQLMPAISVMLGMVKELVSGSRQAKAQTIKGK